MGIIEEIRESISMKIRNFLRKNEKPDEILDDVYETQIDNIKKMKEALMELITSKERMIMLKNDLNSSATKNNNNPDKYEMYQQQITELDNQILALTTEEEKMISELERLSLDLNKFKIQKDVILARYSAAAAKNHMKDTVYGIGEGMCDKHLRISRVMDTIEHEIARSRAYDSIEIPTISLENNISGHLLTNSGTSSKIENMKYIGSGDVDEEKIK